MRIFDVGSNISSRRVARRRLCMTMSFIIRARASLPLPEWKYSADFQISQVFGMPSPSLAIVDLWINR